MIPVEQAEQLILDVVQPFDPAREGESVELMAAVGRTLAVTVTSALDFPHWDNSAMDGYAVRFADVQNTTPEQAITLEVVEEIPAGTIPKKNIQPGQAARILTGSMLPKGADTVVMQENTERQGTQVKILVVPERQEFVRPKGAFYQAGAPLLPAGLRLQAPEIAVLAAAQCDRVTVYRRPRVAILSTGDELVGLAQPLQPGQIVDSNRYALMAQLMALGAEPVLLGIIPDRPDALRQAIAQAVDTADVVLSSGGVSVGDYDYVDGILAELGAMIHLRSVAIRPGKPLTVATFARSPRPVLYFGLPGNPVSALVTFWRFVQPALQKLMGRPQPWIPQFVTATTRHTLKGAGRREAYLWGQVSLVNGHYEFSLPGGGHSSGNLINLAGTNGLAVVPLGETIVAAGDAVQVMLIG